MNISNLNFSNAIFNLIYGVLCFLFAPLIFMLSGFYLSFILTTIFSLFLYILIPEQFIIVHLLFGLFTSFWGVGIMSEKTRLKRKLTSTEELNIGFQSVGESIGYLLTSVLIACYVFAVLSLFNIGNDFFRNVILIIAYLSTHMFFLSKLYSTDSLSEA